MSDAETLPDRLLALQRIDTDADQRRLALERLPERAELASATERLTEWERRRRQLRARLDELAAVVEKTEQRDAELAAQRERLERQLRTVIAPREAEALQSELAAIAAERNELDDRELEALEEQVVLDDELAGHLGQEEALGESIRQADEALALAAGDIEQVLAAAEPERAELRAGLPEDLLRRYDKLNAQLGSAVAHLEGKRCGGCHLDLSAAEIDEVKAQAAASGFADCPQCGRMLVP